MFAWPVSRAAGRIAEACGASPETADAVRVGTATVLSPVDPVGGAIGIAHGVAAAEARNGNSNAKEINTALDIASVAVVVVPGITTLPDTTV